ncbi:hypothetical protein ABVK25_010171 [Lepraria finkii]|uniref:Uncharacterized protein n=1 Tax=Lepraria finkii TaxID=1340010 RepID=A0ABR4AXB9_9LECA
MPSIQLLTINTLRSRMDIPTSPDADSGTMSPTSDTHMLFPLLRLLGDVRKIIYEDLFLSKKVDMKITPDPTKSQRKSGCGSRTLNISSSLPFLRVCKQIHSESAAVLHGDHAFFLNDEDYSTEKFRIPGLDTD